MTDVLDDLVENVPGESSAILAFSFNVSERCEKFYPVRASLSEGDDDDDGNDAI